MVWRTRGLNCFVVMLLASPLAVAQTPGAPKPAARKSPSPARPGVRLPVFTPEREAAALAFVRRHHPELAELLGQLENRDPSEYKRAISELFSTSERLAETQVLDPERYQLDLKAWKLASRVRLLTAQLSMSRDPALEGQLWTALGEQVDVRLELQMLQRKRTAEKLRRLDEYIERLRGVKDQQVERTFGRLVRQAGRRRARAAVVKTGQPARKSEKSGTAASGPSKKK